MTTLVTICGWTLWCFVALLSLGLILSSDRDGGVRFLMRTNGVVLAIGLAVTVVFPVSKFHLLWFVPVSPLISMSIMRCRVNRALSRSLSAGNPAGKPAETHSRHDSGAKHAYREISEEDAIRIAAEFGEAYATCNEERWLFKPQSLLPREPDTVVCAMKVSYQSGYPFPEELEDSYRHCFPQIAFFVPDDQFDRAMAYFERLRKAIKNERHHSLFLNFEWAGAVLNCARGMSANGDEYKDVFETTFLADAPADPDKLWVQQLARDCWRDFRSRIAEWSQFATLVKTGETGLEPKDVALARIELNKTRREIDECIPSLQLHAQKSTYPEIIAQID